MTVKNVLNFMANVLSYIDLFGSPEEGFAAEFHERCRSLGRVIQEEAGTPEGQKVEHLTILGPRARKDFEELKAWCLSKRIDFNS